MGSQVGQEEPGAQRWPVTSSTSSPSYEASPIDAAHTVPALDDLVNMVNNLSVPPNLCPQHSSHTLGPGGRVCSGAPPLILVQEISASGSQGVHLWTASEQLRWVGLSWRSFLGTPLPDLREPSQNALCFSYRLLFQETSWGLRGIGNTAAEA